MNYTKPFYTLKINSKHCGYRLAVNGCLVEEDRIGEPLNMEYPINQWLKNGENTIDIHHLNITTLTDDTSMHEEGQFTVELRVKEHGEQHSTVVSTIAYDATKLKRYGEDDYLVDFDNQKALLDSIAESSKPIQFDIVDEQIKESDSGAFQVIGYEVKKGITKALQITQTIQLPTPFPLWRFFEADDLIYHNDYSDDDWLEERANMIKVYQPLWDALNTNDTEAMKKLFAARCKEYDQAFYMEDGQNLWELIVHLRGIIKDDEWVLSELEFDAVDFCVAFNHKITWLHHWKLSLDSSLIFEHVEADFEKSIPVMWSKFDGQWEIVR